MAIHRYLLVGVLRINSGTENWKSWGLKVVRKSLQPLLIFLPNRIECASAIRRCNGRNVKIWHLCTGAATRKSNICLINIPCTSRVWHVSWLRACAPTHLTHTRRRHSATNRCTPSGYRIRSSITFAVATNATRSSVGIIHVCNAKTTFRNLNCFHLSRTGRKSAAAPNAELEKKPLNECLIVRKQRMQKTSVGAD